MCADQQCAVLPCSPHIIINRVGGGRKMWPVKHYDCDGGQDK